MTLPNDYWTEDGLFFVHYDEKYGVNQNLRTICLGSAEPLDRPDKPSGKKMAVAKLLDKGILGQNSFDTEIDLVLKHPGGRPRKEKEVSRATAWRREKEKAEQGALLL